MPFSFSGQGLTGSERLKQRFFEMAPGATSWAILLGTLSLSFGKPLLAAVGIIAFDLYWLLRLLSMTLFLVLSYLKLSRDRTVDWAARIRDLDQHIERLRHSQQPDPSSKNCPLLPEASILQPLWSPKGQACGTDNFSPPKESRNCLGIFDCRFWIFDWKPPVQSKIDNRQSTISPALLNRSSKPTGPMPSAVGPMAGLRHGRLPASSSEIYHLVIIPIAKERREMYEPGVRRLIQQPFPSSQFLVVLAVEGRASSAVQADAYAVRQQYQDHFFDCLVVVHPDAVPGETRVKGANITHAAKAAALYLSGRDISFDRVIVSCFDADTVVSPQYFGCLTYSFMLCPDRTQVSFQPIPVYHNNIWEVPGFARVLDVGASFFQLIEATHPEQLVTFSSHSMSFKALVEVGYWPVDIISDDSAIFWKAFIHYEGNYRVVPMYVTVSMDVAASHSWLQTVVNVYRQKRRWAWGVENFPIVMRAFLRSCSISRIKRLQHAWKLFDDHVAWATWPFLLGVLGWLPALCAGREFSDSVAFYMAPRVTFAIFHLASIGFLTTSLLSLLLLPSPAVKRPWLRKTIHMAEWLLVPVITIFLSAVPALDAQTRLMLGKRLEFWVTDKQRRSPGSDAG